MNGVYREHGVGKKRLVLYHTLCRAMRHNTYCVHWFLFVFSVGGMYSALFTHI